MWDAWDPVHQNYSAICDKVIDRGYAQAARTVDSGKRIRLYRVIERRMNQQAHWLPLYYSSNVWADSGRVRHFKGSFWNVADWTVKGR